MDIPPAFLDDAPENQNLVILRRLSLEVALERGQKNLRGYCAAVACMVHGVFGGEVVAGRISGEPHYWNRLPNGREVDLTSCQFDGDGFTPLKKGRKVKRPELIDPWFMFFAARVLEKLNGR